MDSITLWTRRLQEGDRDVVGRLWQASDEQFVRPARGKLQGLPRHLVDDELVPLSAFKSLCRAAEQKSFPKLQDRDVCQVRVLLTRNKAADLRQHHGRGKRDFRGATARADLLAAADSGEVAGFLGMLEGGEPDPLFAAEQFERLLGASSDDHPCRIAVDKMEGYTNAEIARRLECAEAILERRLARIRQCWERAATR